MWRKSDITFPKAYSLTRSSSGCISFAPVSLLRDYICRLHITYVWGVHVGINQTNNSTMMNTVIMYIFGLGRFNWIVYLSCKTSSLNKMLFIKMC